MCRNQGIYDAMTKDETDEGETEKILINASMFFIKKKMSFTKLPVRSYEIFLNVIEQTLFSLFYNNINKRQLFLSIPNQ